MLIMLIGLCLLTFNQKGKKIYPAHGHHVLADSKHFFVIYTWENM